MKRRLRIERGADVNAKDDQQDSPFLYAGTVGRLQILRQKRAGGADQTRTHRCGAPPAAGHASLTPAAELLSLVSAPSNSCTTRASRSRLCSLSSTARTPRARAFSSKSSVT